MKNIVFIGNSVANVNAIEQLRAKNGETQITLISSDAFLPYSRQLLSGFLGKEIKEKQMFYRPESFYKENKIRVITNQPVARINFKKNQVVLENKEQISFDLLVLADIASPRLTEIKGHNKKGVFHAVRLASVKDIIEQLTFTQTIVLEVSSLSGFLNLCAISHYQKETIVASAADTLLADRLDIESASMLKQLLEYQGIRVMMANPLEEILGDSDLKAVRLKSGKVLSTEMVILDDVKCDTRIFKETGLEVQQSDDSNAPRPNIKNVFWMDAVASAFFDKKGGDYNFVDADLENQGQRLIQHILSDHQDFKSKDFVLKFKVKELKGCLFGETLSTGEVKETFRFYPDKNVYKKLFIKDGKLVGGVIFNAQEDFDKYLNLFTSNVNIQEYEDQLLEEVLQLERLAGGVVQ